MNYTSGNIKPITEYCNSQIHVSNPKSLVEKSLLNLYKRFFLYAVIRFVLRFENEENVFAKNV